MAARFEPVAIVVIVLFIMGLQGCSPADSPTEEARDDTGTPTATQTVSFVENTSEPFGTFDAISFVRHTGFFEGETSLGAFRMPYEIIAPEDPALSNGTVLMEPPHFQLRTVGRDVVLGRDLVFQTVSGYATVGFGDNGQNILQPGASDLLLAGEPVERQGVVDVGGVVDEEILIQFARALTDAPFARDLLGEIDRLYVYGLSQTADTLLETQRNFARTSRLGLFDLTLLHTPTWNVQLLPDLVFSFDFLGGDFEPLQDVGKVLIVETEGDLVISDSEQFRKAAGEPNYRVYEIAGADHLPMEQDNPLDHAAVTRALFVAGDRWVRSGTEPPPSTFLEPGPPGQVDPVYKEETGIARDGDLNARGGVRLPALELGRAQFIASDPTTSVPRMPPEFDILSGSMVDLACEPEPGSDSDEPRFSSHEAYVAAINQQVDQLQEQGFLLEAEAAAMKERAAASDVGKPGTCEG